MIPKTRWNIDFHNPQQPLQRKSKRQHPEKASFRVYKNEGYYDEGEIYALVYAAIIDGVNRIVDIAKLLNRTEPRIVKATRVLEASGYIVFTPKRRGSVSWKAWHAVEKPHEETAV